jgi:hypothetical protein
MPRAKEVTVSIPGWLSVKFAPNTAERKAAWSLYIELSTRIAAQPFDRKAGVMREVLNSLYTLFDFTRQVLREAGPEVAHGPDSFGPVAIRFLTEVLAPFTTKWHQPLLVYEALRPNDRNVLKHERQWERFTEMSTDLQALQEKVHAYTEALAKIASIA